MVTPSALFCPAFYDDPYPFYRQLRETDPVHHDARMGWLITCYVDIKALALDPRLSRGRFEERRMDGVPEEAQTEASCARRAAAGDAALGPATAHPPA
jgi:cytochrome P450